MSDRPPDATSASSTDSFRPPPRLDNTRIKPGPGALPTDAFDPLKHEDWEQFWYHIDQYYQPVNQQHVQFLRSIPVNPYAACRDSRLRLPLSPHASSAKRDKKMPPANGEGSCAGSWSLAGDEGGDGGGITAALNSFPYTHRLVAALLDGGGGGREKSNVSFKTSRTGGDVGKLWIGAGREKEVRDYQVAYEERIRRELVESGLVDEEDDDELQRVIRQEQWKLRDVKQGVRMRKTALYTQVIGVELRAQAIRREIKKHHDQVEMAYLERMVSKLKKNKKSRSKFQKLLQRMFGHYKDKDKAADKMKKAAETISNGRLLTNGEEKGRSMGKKKKKRGDVVALKAGSSTHPNLPKKGTN